MSGGLAIVVPFGPGKNTPERRASLRRCSVKAVREKLAEHSRASVKTWVHVGKELAGVKKAAKEDGPKVFPALFARNAEERKDENKYPFSRQTADIFIAISARFAHACANESLPASWRTLYELSRIEPSRLQKLIASGGIHPTITRPEAKRFAAQPNQKRRMKATSCRSARTFFLEIRAPKDRAKKFFAFMRECGITIEQLKEIAK